MPSKHFHILIDKCKEVHDKKSHDYAQDSDPFSNFKYADYIAKPFPNGYKSYAVLIGIKLARLAELLSSGKAAKNESLEDSFVDAVNYVGLMGASYLSSQEFVPTKYNPEPGIYTPRGDGFTIFSNVADFKPKGIITNLRVPNCDDIDWSMTKHKFVKPSRSDLQVMVGMSSQQCVQCYSTKEDSIHDTTSHQKRSKIRSRTVQTRNTRVQGRSLSKSREESRKKS